MIESILAGLLADISIMTRQLVGQSEVKLLRRDSTEILKSIVVKKSDLPPDVREIMRPTIIACLNSPKDKSGVYGGVPENVQSGEPQTAYNLLRWLCNCGGTKSGLLRKLYWAILTADDTLVAKGCGHQAFLDMFGSKHKRIPSLNFEC